MTDDALKDFPQPVHFVGVGGAGMSGIAAGAPRPRRARDRLRSQGVAVHAPPRRGRRAGGDRARRRQPRRRRRGRHLVGHPRDQPRGARGARRRPAGAAARRDAGPRHAPAARHRRGRHARQDHHLLDDLPRASPVRAGPHLPRGRRAQRHGVQRRGGAGRVARGRGRRERRQSALPAPGDRRGGQRGAGPPRQLRLPRRGRRRVPPLRRAAALRRSPRAGGGERRERSSRGTRRRRSCAWASAAAICVPRCRAWTTAAASSPSSRTARSSPG